MKAKIWNNKKWIKETNPEILKELFENLLIESKFGILSFQEHYFAPQGYSAIWVISESHLAIHTFPEHNKSYIELSSCNKKKQKYFKRKLKLIK